MDHPLPLIGEVENGPGVPPPLQQKDAQGHVIRISIPGEVWIFESFILPWGFFYLEVLQIFGRGRILTFRRRDKPSPVTQSLPVMRDK